MKYLILLFALSVAAVKAQAEIFSYTIWAQKSVPGFASSHAPGFETSSWQHRAGMSNEIYVSLLPYGMTPPTVSVSQVSSISYWTNKPGDSDATDWILFLCTGSDALNRPVGLISEPRFTSTPSGTTNTWHLWSTDDPNNPLRFYPGGMIGLENGFAGLQAPYGSYDDPTWAQILAGSITSRDGTTHDFRSDPLVNIWLYTRIPWARTFDGLVDGITVTLNTGDVYSINLEDVPEPATWLLSATALGFLGAIRLRRR